MIIALIALSAFVALTAIAGGLAMAFDVDRRVDPAWLDGTPFSSYRLPGVALAGLVGGSALTAVIALLNDDTLGAGLSVAAGLILVGWIAVEIRLLNQPDAPTVTEWVYLGLGGAMSVIGLGVLVT